MRSVVAVCGLAVMALFLSGCGGGSQSAMSSGSSGPTSTSSGSPSVPSTGDAKLTWSAPTTNSNGTALTDLAGYDIHYGTNYGSLTNVVDVSSASAVSYTVTGLTSGTWYFAISAYTNTGLQSALSNVGSKTIS
ncbi:MAG: fibronectin type III domain-containing protein [Steroidobacteraceae bacterium]